MRRYELMLLLSPDLEDDKLQAAVEKVTRAIVNAGGSLSKVSPWGKRRLAYDIGKHRDASYFLIHFDIEPAQVREIERGLLITEEILRHLVTVLEDRGPVDDLAPAAAARSIDDVDDDDVDDDDVDDDADDDLDLVAAEAPAADTGEDAATGASEDTDDGDDTSEDSVDEVGEDTSEGTIDEDEPDEAPDAVPPNGERTGG